MTRHQMMHVLAWGPPNQRESKYSDGYHFFLKISLAGAYTVFEQNRVISIPENGGKPSTSAIYKPPEAGPWAYVAKNYRVNLNLRTVGSPAAAVAAGPVAAYEPVQKRKVIPGIPGILNKYTHQVWRRSSDYISMKPLVRITSLGLFVPKLLPETKFNDCHLDIQQIIPVKFEFQYNHKVDVYVFGIIIKMGNKIRTRWHPKLKYKAQLIHNCRFWY